MFFFVFNQADPKGSTFNSCGGLGESQPRNILSHNFQFVEFSTTVERQV